MAAPAISTTPATARNNEIDMRRSLPKGCRHRPRRRRIPSPHLHRDNLLRPFRNMQALSREPWETYYRGGAIATCPTAPDGGYDLEVRQAWVEFFSTLADGARILDVGTGNGVVALIASETASATGRHWEIHGTDLAQIDPPRHVPDGARRFAGITFHAGVATERLPFEAQGFDAVSGHYALEYTDTAAALAEIRRVLKPGSEAQFIMHHADSALVHSARLSLRESEFVLKRTKIYRRLHRLVTMEQVTPGTTERVTAELRAAIQALKQALQQARQAGAGQVLSVALDAVQKLLVARREMKPQAAGLEVDRAEAELHASARRLNDLIAHARNETDMAAIEQQAATAGFTRIERLPQFHDGSNLVGWQLLLHRP
ncbi:class I SAM-dependent methyltransferase [Luteimonas salinilitoris]|uniref:Class I SAM-dependent methyltransferase n=1 Tax=Luteimonas salinilitoris TaxID=3237697 RepID=A0ABV4HY14_9GAMM